MGAIRMKIFSLISLFFAFSIMSPIMGADQENGYNGATLLLEGRRDALIAQIGSAQKSIGIATPFFSDTKVQGALVAAHERGVPVTVYVAGRAKADRLAHAGMKVELVKDLHAKLAIIDDAVVIGSDNWSQVSAVRSAELAVLVHTPRTAAQGRRAFARIPYLAGAGAGATPQHPTPGESKMMRGHSGYKADRMRAFVADPSSDNRLDVFSMGLDSDRFVREVEATYAGCPADMQPRMRFFLDKSALTHTGLLDRLKAAGGDRLSIRIFNADRSQKIWGRFTDLAHQKAITRSVTHSNGTVSTHVIISTGNLCVRSDQEVNFDYHRPGDDALHGQLEKLGDTYESDSAWTLYHSDVADATADAHAEASGAAADDQEARYQMPRRSKRLAAKRALQGRVPQMPMTAPQPRRASRKIASIGDGSQRRSPRLAALRAGSRTVN